MPAKRNRELIKSDPTLASLIDPAGDFSVWSLVVENESLAWDKPGEINGEEILAAAERISAKSPAAIRKLVSQTRAEDAGLAVFWSSPTLRCWQSKPGWTVIGDAIHSMVPLRGRGASAAIVDAKALCETLRSRALSPKKAKELMANFEAAMHRRNAPQVRSSLLLLWIARGKGMFRWMFLNGLRISSLFYARRSGSR
jgi:2-polyprenyl-6-methoxyphenol hydroxylase-like FAD-dependent oxidoreductase